MDKRNNDIVMLIYTRMNVRLQINNDFPSINVCLLVLAPLFLCNGVSVF